MARGYSSKVSVDCRVLDESPKAIFIEVQDGPRTRREWIPLSCVHEIHRAAGIVVMDEWIAAQKDLL